MRQEAITAAYQSAKGRLDGMSLDDFTAAVEHAEVVPVVVGGECAGALIIEGPEIHACVLPWACGKWMSKRLVRVLNRVISDYGFAITSATTAAGEAFVKALGFEPCGLGWIKKVKYGH